MASVFINICTYLSAAPLELKCSGVSFLFSLRNKDNFPPFKCSIYDHQIQNPIRRDASHGAIFGEDLCISDNANTNQLSLSNLGHTYQPPPGYQRGTPKTKALLAGSDHFTPSEIEVFRV